MDPLIGFRHLMRAAKVIGIGQRRLLILLTATLAVAVTLSFGLVRASASCTTCVQTTTTLAVTNSDGTALQATTDASGNTVYVVPSGQVVKLTATVSDSAGIVPAGPVSFQGNNSGSFQTIGTGSVSQASSSSATASYTTTLQPGTYQLRAVFSQNTLLLLGTSVSTPATNVEVTTSLDYNPTTQVIAQPNPVTTGQDTTLTATVTESYAGAPTPQGTVTFYSIGGGGYRTLINTATLQGGQAAITTSFGTADTYTIEADYSGWVYTDSNNNQVQYNASNPDTAGKTTLTVNPQPGATPTQTTVSLTASAIRAGEPVGISAHVSQVGNPLSSVDGTVEFYAATQGSQGYGVPLGSVLLDSQGNARLTVPNSSYASPFGAGTYEITASYVGNVFNTWAQSSAQAPLIVNVPVATTTTYLHDVHTYVGSDATMSAQVLASNGQPVPAGELVTLTASDPNATGCIGTTDATGTATCTIDNPFQTAGTYSVTASYGGDSTYVPSTGIGQIVVDQVPTSVTVTATPNPVPTGAQVTLSGTLTDTLHNVPVAGAQVTLTLNNNETCAPTTDGNGNVSCTVTVSETPGSYQVTAAYAGSAEYVPSNGGNSLTVTAIQPTHLSYLHDASALAGQPASIAFRLTDDNGNPMAGRQVTLTLGSQSWTVTTDPSGVATQPVMAPATAGTYTPTAHYGGETGYLASDGSGTLQVTTIPTSLTYTGSTTVNGGTPATISFVLTDGGGHTLAGQTVTLGLPGGGSYTGTTDANGVVSDSITAPTASVNTAYTPTASFNGSLPYLASQGSGTLNVNVVPTTIVYTGDTSVNAGAPAHLSFVLTDATNGHALANMPVTLTLPDGSTYNTTTDANGVASDTVNAPTSTGSFPVSESFGGQAQYLPSTGKGALVVTTIPTSVTYVGDTSVYQGGTATLAAKLLDNRGNPLANEQVTLTLSTGETCSATTNAAGVASCQVVVNEATTLSVSPYDVAISFGGDLPYLPSSGHGSLAVVAQYPAPATVNCSATGKTAAKCESLLADPTVVSNTQLTIVATDDATIPTTGACAPSAVLDNGQQLFVTTSPTSGQPVNYVNSYKGSLSAKNQVLISIKLPSNLGSGTHSIQITACDDDGDLDQWTWTIAAAGNGSVATANPGPGPVTCSTVKCESLLADPAVVSDSQLSIVAMDDSAIVTAGANAPSATVDGQPLGISAAATSGQPQNYVDSTGGSLSAKYQTLLTIDLPLLAPGSHSVLVTAYDGDGDLDQWSWPITVAGDGTVTSNFTGGAALATASQNNSITAPFTNAVSAGNTLWLSSTTKVSGLPAAGATITFTNQMLTAPDGTTIALPDAELQYSPTASSATTTWDPVNNEWDTIVPAKLGGNIFATGFGVVSPVAIPKNTKFTWSATISSDTPRVSVAWQWAAAAYTSFNSDFSQLGVKPCDDGKASIYPGGDKAGTPESYKAYVTSGGTGAGGGNFTGNFTPAANVKF